MYILNIFPPGVTCRPDCSSYLESLSSIDPCLDGDAYYFVSWISKRLGGPQGAAVYNMMHSCDADDNDTSEDGEEEEEGESEGNDGGRPGMLCPEDRDGTAETGGGMKAASTSALWGIGIMFTMVALNVV